MAQSVDAGRRGGVDLSSWERYAGIAGILFVLALLGTFVTGSTPNPADPAGKVASSLAQHRSGELATVYIQIAAAIPLLIFLTGLRSILHRGEGEPRVLTPLAFGAALLGIAIVLVSHGILGALAAFVVKGSSADVTRALYAVYQGVFIISDFFLGAFLLAASLVMIRSRIVPGWLGWIGIVGGACLVLNTFSFSNPQSILGLLGFLGFILMLLWVLITSIFMLRGRVAV